MPLGSPCSIRMSCLLVILKIIYYTQVYFLFWVENGLPMQLMQRNHSTITDCSSRAAFGNPLCHCVVILFKKFYSMLYTVIELQGSHGFRNVNACWIAGSWAGILKRLTNASNKIRTTSAKKSCVAFLWGDILPSVYLHLFALALSPAILVTKNRLGQSTIIQAVAQQTEVSECNSPTEQTNVRLLLYVVRRWKCIIWWFVRRGDNSPVLSFVIPHIFAV